MRRQFKRDTAVKAAAALALVASFIAGCSTLEDVRASEPKRSGEFRGNYKAVSGCAADQLMARHSVSQVVREDQRTAILLNSSGADLVGYEARLIELADNRFRAEIRGPKDAFGNDNRGITAAWAAIESCAQKV